MMWNRSRTIAVGGVVAGLVIAGGGAAIASSPNNPSPSSPVTAKHARGDRAPWPGVASRIEHGQFVTAGKSGPITHDIVNGDVTAISASAITVRAKDGTTETYAITPKTKVRVRTAGKGAPGAVGDVKVGDHAVVIGTGTSQLTADQIVDIHR